MNWQKCLMLVDKNRRNRGANEYQGNLESWQKSMKHEELTTSDGQQRIDESWQVTENWQVDENLQNWGVN